MQKFIEKSTIRTNTLKFDHFVELKLNPSDFCHIIYMTFSKGRYLTFDDCNDVYSYEFPNWLHKIYDGKTIKFGKFRIFILVSLFVIYFLDINCFKRSPNTKDFCFFIRLVRIFVINETSVDI